MASKRARSTPNESDHHFSAQLLRSGGAGQLRAHLRAIAQRRKVTMGQALLDVVEEAWVREKGKQ